MKVLTSVCVLMVVVVTAGCGGGNSSVTAPEDVASDPAFAAAVEEAKASFNSEFVPAWRAKQRTNTYFKVKVGYPSDVGGTVYVWVDVSNLANGKVIGEIAESPEFSIGKEIGDKVAVDPSEVVDWLYFDIDGNVTGDYTTDAHTAYLIKKRG